MLAIQSNDCIGVKKNKIMLIQNFLSKRLNLRSRERSLKGKVQYDCVLFFFLFGQLSFPVIVRPVEYVAICLSWKKLLCIIVTNLENLDGILIFLLIIEEKMKIYHNVYGYRSQYATKLFALMKKMFF